MKPTDFSKCVTLFISNFLPVERGLSDNSIKSYRDTLVLLIRFFETEKKINQNRLQVKHIKKEVVIEFLNWLQTIRKISNSTRNNRLAGIKAFFSFVQDSNIEYMFEAQRILSIRSKKSKNSTISYLTKDGIKLLLEQPNLNTKRGRRDMVILFTIYDLGLRVQEAIDLTPRSIRMDKPYTARIKGKGNKIRIVPILSGTVEHLKFYLKENNLLDMHSGEYPLFFNSRKEKLTRAGINYILRKYVEKANNSLIPKNLSCHSLRHSRAMHLLESGMTLIDIRDILGHKSVTTTEIYARADTKFKRDALERAVINVDDSEIPKWENNNSLIAWLNKF